MWSQLKLTNPSLVTVTYLDGKYFEGTPTCIKNTGFMAFWILDVAVWFCLTVNERHPFSFISEAILD